MMTNNMWKVLHMAIFMTALNIRNVTNTPNAAIKSRRIKGNGVNEEIYSEFEARMKKSENGKVLQNYDEETHSQEVHEIFENDEIMSAEKNKQYASKIKTRGRSFFSTAQKLKEKLNNITTGISLEISETDHSDNSSNTYNGHHLSIEFSKEINKNPTIVKHKTELTNKSNEILKYLRQVTNKLTSRRQKENNQKEISIVNIYSKVVNGDENLKKTKDFIYRAVQDEIEKAKSSFNNDEKFNKNRHTIEHNRKPKRDSMISNGKPLKKKVLKSDIENQGIITNSLKMARTHPKIKSHVLKKSIHKPRALYEYKKLYHKLPSIKNEYNFIIEVPQHDMKTNDNAYKTDYAQYNVIETKEINNIAPLNGNDNQIISHENENYAQGFTSRQSKRLISKSKTSKNLRNKLPGYRVLPGRINYQNSDAEKKNQIVQAHVESSKHYDSTETMFTTKKVKRFSILSHPQTERHKNLAHATPPSSVDVSEEHASSNSAENINRKLQNKKIKPEISLLGNKPHQTLHDHNKVNNLKYKKIQKNHHQFIVKAAIDKKLTISNEKDRDIHFIENPASSDFENMNIDESDKTMKNITEYENKILNLDEFKNTTGNLPFWQINDTNSTNPKLNLKKLLKKMTEQQILDNITDYLLDKMFQLSDSRNKKKDSVERIEVVLDSGDSETQVIPMRVLGGEISNDPEEIQKKKDTIKQVLTEKIQRARLGIK